MKKISIISKGVGTETMTPQALKAIADAEVLLDCYRPADIKKAVSESGAQHFAVTVSGDVGFYSAAAGIRDELGGYELEFIPGVSTVNAFFARLGMLWQDAALISAHGRDVNLPDTVRRNRLTFCLTGNNAAEIAKNLGGIPVYVGENLGTAGERVYRTTAAELESCPSLTVLLFQNDHFDDRCPAGLPDGVFARLEGVPMTKSEARAIIMSKLRLRPDDIVWDIGAGSGAVTCEMALSAYRGRVFAIERREEAIRLIEENCRRLHIGNVTTICGEAPAALKALPKPDVVFIGGGGGRIIEAVRNKRLVASAITPETVAAALELLPDAELVQINAARGKKLGGLHLMEAQNPITIISSEGGA